MKMLKIQNICALCKNETQLCESHIIPKFCFRPLLDDKRRINSIRFNEKAEPRLVQDGWKEKLLCKDCEQIICGYERNFSEIWMQSSFLRQPINEEYVLVKGVDYTAFKLFHLSILWRFACAKQSGCEVVLGEYYFEKIRTMLLNQEAGPQENFPVVGVLLVDENRNITHFASEPLVFKMGQSRIYGTPYAGCEWWVLMTDHISPSQKDFCLGLKENGDMLLIVSNIFNGLHFKFITSNLKRYREKNLSKI